MVRVVTAGDSSIEFCGGTHVSNTAQIGLCKIVSESSVAAGVRRIELVTGANVLKLLAQTEQTLLGAAKALKLANPAELPEKCAAMSNELREKAREIEQMNQKMANSQLADLFNGAQEVAGMKIVSAKLTDVKPDTLRKLGDRIREKEENVIALLAGVNGSSGNLYCVCSKSAVAKGAHAGKIIQQTAAATGGKGGGKPDNAMGGIGDAAKTDEALAMLAGIAGGMLQ